MAFSNRSLLFIIPLMLVIVAAKDVYNSMPEKSEVESDDPGQPYAGLYEAQARLEGAGLNIDQVIKMESTIRGYGFESYLDVHYHPMAGRTWSWVIRLPEITYNSKEGRTRTAWAIKALKGTLDTPGTLELSFDSADPFEAYEQALTFVKQVNQGK